MFKHRVARNRVLYFLVFVGILGLFAYLITDYRWEFYQLLIIAVAFVLPGRVVQLFWREFFAGSRKLDAEEYDAAILLLTDFIARIQQRPWLRWLTFFTYGVYSFKIEAVALTRIAAAYIGKGDHDAGRSYLARALSIDTRYSFAYYYQAVIDVLTNDIPKAEDHFRQARAHGYPRMAFEEFLELVHEKYPATRSGRTRA